MLFILMGQINIRKLAGSQHQSQWTNASTKLFRILYMKKKIVQFWLITLNFEFEKKKIHENVTEPDTRRFPKST